MAIDYRAIERSTAGDLAIERIEGPESVLPGESFMITAWIDSPLGQTDLLRIAARLAGDRQGHAGRAVGHQPACSSATRPASAASREYALHVEGEEPDPVPGNNRARLLVGVRGSRPMLCVSPAKASALPALLGQGRAQGRVARRPRSATGRWKNWPAIRPFCWRTRRPT